MSDPMNDSPAPNTPQTADKAIWSAVAVFAAFILARLGIGTMPGEEEVAAAALAIWDFAVAAILSVVGGVTAYLKPNRPK